MCHNWSSRYVFLYVTLDAMAFLLGDPIALENAGKMAGPCDWLGALRILARLGGGTPNYLGKHVQFDEHIFQMGWFNHQLDKQLVAKRIHFPLPPHFCWGVDWLVGLRGVVCLYVFRIYLESTCTWNLFVLYFWASTIQNKIFSNQNSGHLGSRYVLFFPLIFLFDSIWLPIFFRDVFFEISAPLTWWMMLGKKTDVLCWQVPNLENYRHVLWLMWVYNYMGVSENSGFSPPKSSISIGFSIIFTIHFGVPLFLETPISENFGAPKLLKFLDEHPNDSQFDSNRRLSGELILWEGVGTSCGNEFPTNSCSTMVVRSLFSTAGGKGKRTLSQKKVFP